MSYSANQYNYATPLSSTQHLIRGNSGAQLFDQSLLFSTERDGVAITNNGDGSFSISGTATSYVSVRADIELQPGTYYVSAPGSTRMHDFRLRVYDSEGSYTDYYIGRTLNITGSEYRVQAMVQAEGGATYNGQPFYPMLNAGSEALPWEPYVEAIHQPIDKKFFTLHDNVLDGSYTPVSGDVGLWGSVLADDGGYLSEPFEIEIEESLYINAFRIVGNAYSYPIDFVVNFYNGDSVVHTIEVTDNNTVDYLVRMPSTITADRVTVSVNRISSNSVARLLMVYNPGYVNRSDSLKVGYNERVILSQLLKFLLSDTLSTKFSKETSHVLNTIDVTTDTLVAKHEDQSTLTNVHSLMKSPFRKIFGKVYITYTDPMLDSETNVTSTSEAYNSSKDQILDDLTSVDNPSYFTLYDNDLTGYYVVNGVDSQVGWSSAELSKSDGTFDKPPTLTTRFYSRPITNLVITFDESRDNLVLDFTVTFTREDGSTVVKEYSNNSEKQVTVVSGTDEGISDVVDITITVFRVAKANSPAVVLDMPISSTILYKGYDDISELMSIDLLEELTYEDDVEALGGISANEITVVLDNSLKQFFFNSGSLVSKQLKRNRKIIPWLGVEVVPGEIEWYTLGTFWSYKWDVPANGLTTTVVGFDTIGLLDNAPYINHQVQINKSLGELIEYILVDAKKELAFLEWNIEDSLYEIIIPYAWFDHSSYAAALRKLSLCYPMHVYCDRQGVVQARSQKLKLDYYYDTWSDNTNVIDKNYSSLYTVLPNIITVQVTMPVVKDNEQLVEDTTLFAVDGVEDRTLNFNSPYIGNLNIVVDCDSSVAYTYSVYSWGIAMVFTGTGNVRSIKCTGSCVDTSTKTTITKQNALSVRLNGAVPRRVDSEFIQTADLANLIINRLFALSENDKYDATVQYRGDIALTINDPILLQDGIAPDNRYNIKRHELAWSGHLTGSADLNT